MVVRALRGALIDSRITLFGHGFRTSQGLNASLAENTTTIHGNTGSWQTTGLPSPPKLNIKSWAKATHSLTSVTALERLPYHLTLSLWLYFNNCHSIAIYLDPSLSH